MNDEVLTQSLELANSALELANIEIYKLKAERDALVANAATDAHLLELVQDTCKRILAERDALQHDLENAAEWKGAFVTLKEKLAELEAVQPRLDSLIDANEKLQAHLNKRRAELYAAPKDVNSTHALSFAEAYPANPAATCKCEHWQACKECHPTAFVGAKT